jgi:hypothetical protein
VETAVLLAKIGANATVVSAGLLHDTIDDSFVDYDHIFHMFGTGVADLVEGVCIRFGSLNINIFIYPKVVGRINCNYLISIMMISYQLLNLIFMCHIHSTCIVLSASNKKSFGSSQCVTFCNSALYFPY